MDDKRIVLMNSQFGRAHGVGTWTKLRIGLRMIMNNTGANITGTPRFYVGLCSGTTNMIMDATTNNWCGVATASATWEYTAGPPKVYTGSGSVVLRAAKRVGSTYTENATQLNDQGAWAVQADATLANRFLHFIDITKGSPNYTFDAAFMRTNTGTLLDSSLATFLSQVVLDPPNAQGGHTAANTPLTLAVDESGGTFTHVNIGWNQATPTIEICDLAVVKLA